MSYYVKRQKRGEDRVGYIGPIRSARQAAKEATAWEDCGWDSQILWASEQVRAEVKAWEKTRSFK